MKRPPTEGAIVEDRELVQKLLANDKEAQGLFYDRYRDSLYRTCVYVLGYQDRDAEDLVQETFLTALQKLSGFEFRSSLARWLNRICAHLCYKQLRKRKRLVTQLDEELERISNHSNLEQQRRKQQEEERREMLELLESQKGLLGKPCRELLELRDGAGKSYADLADTLKIPMGTVMSRLARCKESLKELVLRALSGRGK